MIKRTISIHYRLNNGKNYDVMCNYEEKKIYKYRLYEQEEDSSYQYRKSFMTLKDVEDYLKEIEKGDKQNDR